MGTLLVSALRSSATSIDHLFSNSPQQGNHYVKYTVGQVEISLELSVSAVYIVFAIGGSAVRFPTKKCGEQYHMEEHQLTIWTAGEVETTIYIHPSYDESHAAITVPIRAMMQFVVRSVGKACYDSSLARHTLS